MDTFAMLEDEDRKRDLAMAQWRENMEQSDPVELQRLDAEHEVFQRKMGIRLTLAAVGLAGLAYTGSQLGLFDNKGSTSDEPAASVSATESGEK